MGEMKCMVEASPQCRRQLLGSMIAGFGFLLSATFLGCSRQPEVKVPGYLKNAEGNLVELTPREIETLSKEAEELNAKREAEKGRSASR